MTRPLNERRVVVTGMAGISPIGTDWNSALAHLQTLRNAVQRMPGWDEYIGLHTRLGAPAVEFSL
ncbi:hypothetical protein ABTH30_21800, partial [Acinetobacter baumannii]